MALAGLAFAPSYPWLVIALLLGGLGNAAFHPYATALAGDWTEGRGSFGMSFFLIGGELGRALAPLAVTALYFAGGRPQLGWLRLPGMVMAVALWVGLNPPPAPRPSAAVSWSADLCQGLKQARPVLVVTAYSNMLMLAVVTLTPILWHQLHRSLSQAAWLLTVWLGAGSLSNITGGLVSDRLGHRRVLIAAALATTACLTGFVWLSGVWPWLAPGLSGFSLYSMAGVVTLLGQSLLPGRKRLAPGLIRGLGNTAGGFGVGPATALEVAGCLLLFIVPVVWRFRAPKPVAARTG